MDLETREYHKADINSDFAEGWHSFSSNSQWITFSSKRAGGTFTRLFFSYVDKQGKAHKPFVLPQKDPEFYDSLIRVYSVPELITGPVQVSERDILSVIRSPEQIQVDIPITAATPKAEMSDSWQAPALE